MRFLTSTLFVCLFLTSCVFESGWPGSACIQGIDSAKYFVAQTDTFIVSSYPTTFAEEVLQTRENAQRMVYMSIVRGPTDLRNRLGLNTPAASNAFCSQTIDEIKRLSPQLKPKQ